MLSLSCCSDAEDGEEAGLRAGPIGSEGGGWRVPGRSGHA